ncbi:NAD(P)H-dependent oxidoreductase [Chondrinema litorale]|uniref:NAD(P)H-dependent oxidoreductase n=1 Tax=Chondrinema litorale TaxID=2994555 RepID=UPI002542AAC3|nr:NAD(P)H-dependent oxidoreductase [Chondrinema litorale]UZR97926.1 NAD(P)H-dependent oxidoreductase [Chondrinema litorale]
MQLLENLKWRYATKKFDPNKKVPTKDIAKLKEVIRLSASSYGLQMYKVLIIEDQKLKEKLKPVSWNQNQITDASHLFVFCSYTSVSEAYIKEHMSLIADTQSKNIQDLQGYGDFVLTKLSEKSSAEQQTWLEKQTYLAMSNLLAACAELKIDACPMEGFEVDKYNEILGLTEKGLSVSLIAPIGYRAKDDYAQFSLKVRKPVEKLFELL